MRPRALYAIACLVVAAPLSAQDAFSRVTVEPRPEEHLHWDAAAFAAKRAELEARLAEGGGARVWHQLVLDEGQSTLYALNINEPGPAN